MRSQTLESSLSLNLCKDGTETTASHVGVIDKECQKSREDTIDHS